MIQEIRHLSNNPTMERQVKLVPNVIYSTAGGEEIPLTLILPWNLDIPQIEKTKKPLIVYVQGSGWTTPDRDFQIPQLSEFARNGYVVASVSHRSALNGHAFPAYLQDVKCAIRFLRKHAGEYGIDESRIAIWGTSSGGNTALLVGLTGDDERFKTEEYAEYSDSVNAVVECFAPTHLAAMSEVADDEDYELSDIHYIMSGLCGGDMSIYENVVHDMSPVFHVKKDGKKIPYLLLHGDNDPIVPFEQMLLMYDKLKECGYDVEAWQIEGAEHEGTFWSDEVYHVIGEFLKKSVMQE